MNNIFLFDVDGTIAVGDVILDSTIKALEELRAKGNIVMLSTGRCIGQMKDLLQRIKIDGAICNNGAYAYIGNDVIFESPISNDVINQMLDDGLHVTFLARDSYFRLDDLKIYDDFAKVFNIVPAELQDKNYLINNNIYSIGVQDYTLDFDVTKYDLNFIKVCDLGYDVINKGIYDRNRSFIKTYSPSMDILVSSNSFLLAHLFLAAKDFIFLVSSESFLPMAFSLICFL